eukprot:754609-Hanusia_phi.AAC.1
MNLLLLRMTTFKKSMTIFWEDMANDSDLSCPAMSSDLLFGPTSKPGNDSEYKYMTFKYPSSAQIKHKLAL